MRILSGIQPTGAIHLGNYMGALRHWVALQAEAQCFYLVADLHAITVPYLPRELEKRTLSAAAMLLAVGVDPDRSTLFVQSHVTGHTELAWILATIANSGELQRMTQFKGRVAKKRAITMGLFAYPLLQAADILLYQADQVPVGEDQRQHLELTRELAFRFNSRFGTVLTIPKPIIPTTGFRIMDLRNPQKKMSKSSQQTGGTIWLTDGPDVIRTKIREAVTDSGYDLKLSNERPAIANLLNIFSIASNTGLRDVEQRFENKSYTEFKRVLSEILIDYLKPVQERYGQFQAEPSEIIRILRDGARIAQPISDRTLNVVKQHLGFLEQA